MKPATVKMDPVTIMQTGFCALELADIEIYSQDLYYAAKAINSVFSGVECLEVRDGDDGWVYVHKDYVEGYGMPYYMCVLYKNGQHIPLPMVVDVDVVDEYPEYPLQDWVLSTLYWTGMLDESLALIQSIFPDGIDMYSSGMVHPIAPSRATKVAWQAYSNMVEVI